MVLAVEGCGGKLLQSSFNVCIGLIAVHENATIFILQALLTRPAYSANVSDAVGSVMNPMNIYKRCAILVEVDTVFYTMKGPHLP